MPAKVTRTTPAAHAIVRKQCSSLDRICRSRCSDNSVSLLIPSGATIDHFDPVSEGESGLTLGITPAPRHQTGWLGAEARSLSLDGAAQAADSIPNGFATVVPKIKNRGRCAALDDVQAFETRSASLGPLGPKASSRSIARRSSRFSAWVSFGNSAMISLIVIGLFLRFNFSTARFLIPSLNY